MNWIYNIINRKKNSPGFYSILLIFSIAFISSCTKDALDKTPTDRFSDEAVWQDESLIEAFVNNTYRAIPTSRSAGNYTSTALIFGELTDELYGRGGGHNYINEGNITPSQLGALDYWTTSGANYWSVITQCNIFFQNIGEASAEESLKNRMSGEMHFFRAFAYFRLVSLYGGVPIITKVFDLTDDFNVPKNTYDECMSFVISELNSAAALLPLTYPSANLGRITKGAALAVKSRALLYMASPLNNPAGTTQKWQAAADAAKAVIDLNIYALYSNYKDQFLRANSYNSESIWSRPFNIPVSTELNPENELRLFPNGYSGYAQVHPYQNFVDEFEMTSGKLPKDDPNYDPQNPYVNRDPRFYATILYDGAPFKERTIETFVPGGRDSREGPISSWNATETGYYVRKFIDESVTNPSGINQGNSPWIFFRYAEILLNYAEAKYFLGDEATCRTYINMVRSRPGVNMPNVTESGPSLLTRLQHERQIELCFEEHRWFDVRRWKIAPIVLNKLPTRMDIVKNPATNKKTYTINTMANFKFTFKDKNYVLPIPQVEIDKNPSLVQNTGY
ncbi:MAG TPA: RagB/SusD family nutrient uptake outer membrane protein [Pedobacter sp.]|uniref:RagB/SusD family nutrient uptake outer membrane protein n=1 Tax=Pedobacter sp. TaxID=1411316 RepID=UPI002C0BADBF|nr:RagB/SusD family nutrient uptake outer membrane protein [Pedobacter sp.]HMI05221.1 RagB/SusD family nutrient uptake outer membrane protein [Pedobacter sp.]